MTYITLSPAQTSFLSAYVTFLTILSIYTTFLSPLSTTTSSSFFVFTYFYDYYLLISTFIYSFPSSLAYLLTVTGLTQLYFKVDKFYRYIFSSMACVLSFSYLFFAYSVTATTLLSFSISYLAKLILLSTCSIVLLELSCFLSNFSCDIDYCSGFQAGESIILTFVDESCKLSLSLQAWA